MIKAVFADYTGTLVNDWCDELDELLDRIHKNCSIQSRDEVINEWRRLSKEYEENSYMDTYINEDEICMKVLEYFCDNYSLKEDMDALGSLISGFLNGPNIYPEVKEFFRICPLPVYIISNNGIHYVRHAMKVNGLHSQSIISADDVKAYKPKKEIFERAFELSGCTPDEVIHIGDSYNTDYLGATSLGIKAVLLDRDNRHNRDDIPVVKDFIEFVNLIK
ncbi:MAG: HAD family hydrolase [Anaerofustis stercorihominis]|nr:HAD family hydrolase [Anaerofustis stercorihominis]